VGGPGAGQNLTAHDPTAALAEAETALTNMIAATSKPLIEVFAPAADTFAKAVASFVADKVMPAVEAHPYLTAAAGAAGLGAGGLGAAALGKAALGYVGRSIGEGIRDGVTGAAAGAVAGGGFLGTAARFGAGGAILAGAGAGAYSVWQDPAHAFGGSGWDAAKRLWSGEDRKSSSLPMFASGAMPGAPVMAQLNGQAQIGVSLSIDAPPELLSMIRSGVSTTAFGDLRPDTGVSMPEASPSQGGRNGISR